MSAIIAGAVAGAAASRRRNSTSTGILVSRGRVTDEEIDELAREYAENKRFEELRQQKWERRKPMLWTILVILLVLWLLGAVSGVAGGLIHLLLVVALVIFVINLLTGRRTV